MGKVRWYYLIILIMLVSFSVQAGSWPELGLVYSGELKLTYHTEAGESGWTPGYLFYLQGEPVPGSYVLLYTQPEGQMIDQIFISYSQADWEIELGDMTFQQLGGDFFSYDQNQRGALLRLKDEALTLEVLGALVQGINFQEEIEGIGSVGPYNLSHSSIIPDTIKVKKQGIWLNSSQYQLHLPENNYQLAQITFVEPLEEGEKVEVSYAYQPGGGTSRRILRGMKLAADWPTLQGNFNWVKIQDQPEATEDIGLFFMPPKSFEGRVVELNWQPIPWLQSEGQMAWANHTILQTYQDRAYSGMLHLGNQQTYLQSNYLYQGTDFVTGIDEIDLFSFKETPGRTEKSLTGRWQVDPQCYLFFDTKYVEDLPDPNSTQRAEYEHISLLKGLWQISEISSLQLTLQNKDTGDDLIYIPIGSTLQSGAVNYQHQTEEWGSRLELKAGQELIKAKDEAARDSYHFTSLYTQGNLAWERWRGEMSLDSTYYSFLNSDVGPGRSEYFFKYDLDYNLNPGKLLYHGEEDFYLDEEVLTRHHLYELGYQYRWQSRWQGTVKYQWDQRITPTEEHFKAKVTLHLIQYQPFLIDTRWTLRHKYIFGQTRVKGEGWESQLVWLSSQEIQKGTGSYTLTFKPGVTLESLLTYQRKGPENLAEWMLTLQGQYQIRSGMQLNLSGDFPLGNDLEGELGLAGKAEIIFSI